MSKLLSTIHLYFHGGSGNHGCEAIVRGTAKILQCRANLFSSRPDSDREYGLAQLVNIFEDNENYPARFSWRGLVAAVAHKLFHTDYFFIKYGHRPFFKQVKKGDIALSIGGDNYCYPGQDILGYYNQVLLNRGAKTVLWGCSIEPDSLTPAITEDLARYSAIIARESLSYAALKAVNPHTYLIPDPAFQLPTESVPAADQLFSAPTVGLNVSPLIMKLEKSSGITRQNYCALIEYILQHTQLNIALIPHVVWPENDDRQPLQELYNQYQSSDRVFLIPDCPVTQLKYYISRCRFFVGARTHATIAAYSHSVPTLVVGYSVKARGIAQDIFGTDPNYVIPVQNLQNVNDLTTAFQYLEKHEDEIRQHLQNFMPGYISRALEARKIIAQL